VLDLSPWSDLHRGIEDAPGDVRADRGVVAGVLEEQIELRDDRRAQGEVPLLPVPESALGDELPGGGPVVVQAAVANDGLDGGEERAGVGEIAEDETVPGLDLETGSGQARRFLLDVLGEDAEAREA
jgi:hypothetical protein